MLHFSAANPKRLREYLAQKKEEVRREENIVESLLPKLIAQYEEQKTKSDIEVFYGWEGMKSVYGELADELGRGDENYIFGASLGKDPLQADQFFSKQNRLADKKGYKIKIIFNENMRQYKKRLTYYILKHDVRCLHQDTFTEFNFYKDTVLYVMLLKQPIVIRVRNKENAEAFRKFFDAMWKIAKQ